MTAPWLKPWGIDYHGYSYSPGLDCPGCGWFALSMNREAKDEPWYESIVGFVPCEPRLFSDTENKTGIIVIECPRCFEKFWFHAWESMVTELSVCKNRPR